MQHLDTIHAHTMDLTEPFFVHLYFHTKQLSQLLHQTCGQENDLAKLFKEDFHSNFSQVFSAIIT